MRQIKRILLVVILLLSINVCGCNIDDISKELGSIASEESNIIGNWEITEIISNERIITPDRLEDYAEPSIIALKISLHDDNTATITNGAGKIIKEPCEWEWTDGELMFYSITQYDSEGNMHGTRTSDIAFQLLFDDYAHWTLKDNKLNCRIYAGDLTGSSLSITYERI